MVGKFEKTSKKIIESFMVVLVGDGRKLIITIYQEIKTPDSDKIWGDQQKSVDGHLIFEVSHGAKFLNKVNDDEYRISLNGEEFTARRE